MRVAFRTDSNEVIGTGHIMRDIALAESLAARGDKVRFVCRYVGEAQIDAIRRRGFALDLLPASGAGTIDPGNHSSWLGVSRQRDANETLAAVEAAGGTDWLFADHYGLDSNWHSRMRAADCRIGVIDDLADRQYDCDLLIDQGVADAPRLRYRGRVPLAALLLNGPRFALLRSEFRNARKTRNVRDGTVQKVLVS